MFSNYNCKSSCCIPVVPPPAAQIPAGKRGFLRETEGIGWKRWRKDQSEVVSVGEGRGRIGGVNKVGSGS